MPTFGIEGNEDYQTGNIVEASVAAFILNVIAARLIVVIRLFIFMGRHSATVMAFILLITVAANLATVEMLLKQPI